MPAHLTAPDYESMGDDRVLYQIRVNGHLGPALLTAFPALVPLREQRRRHRGLTGQIGTAGALP